MRMPKTCWRRLFSGRGRTPGEHPKPRRQWCNRSLESRVRARKAEPRMLPGVGSSSLRPEPDMTRALVPNWTRRDLLKGGLAASLGALTADAALEWAAAAEWEVNPISAGKASSMNAASAPAGPLLRSPRERLRLDQAWHFHLGHANDPAQDFGFGAAAREATFAKTEASQPVVALDFDDSGWRGVDLPHDWAVELPFQDGPELAQHGGKPLGRDYPENSIGWYRRVFEIPSSDAGKRSAPRWPTSTSASSSPMRRATQTIRPGRRARCATRSRTSPRRRSRKASRPSASTCAS